MKVFETCSGFSILAPDIAPDTLWKRDPLPQRQFYAKFLIVHKIELSKWLLFLMLANIFRSPQWFFMWLPF